MSKIYFVAVLCGVVFCATSTFAQLSANPWVEANTKEQIDEVYKKYQRRGYSNNSLEYVEEGEVVIEKAKRHIEELDEQEKPSFIEKISANFGDEEDVKEQEDKNPNEPTTNVQTTTPSSSFNLNSKIDKIKNSFRLPSFNTNNMIKSFERSIGVDFKGMAKKFK